MSDKNDRIDAAAIDNANKDWQKNLNPYDSRSTDYVRYNETYKGAGGKN